MIATRLRQFGMLAFSMLLCAVAFFQMFERTTNGFPQDYLWMLAFVGALFLTSWGLLLRFQPYANQSIMCCVMVLTGIGAMMIARIDQDTKTSVAFRQLIWLSIALVLANVLIVFMRDYRVLRRFSYVSMVIGIVLLLWISRSQQASEIGRLMASVNYMTQVLFAVTMIANVINTAVRAMASSERISQVLSEKPAQAQPAHPLTPDITGDICFDHVFFAYAPGKDVLQDISLKIHPGETVGIIGPTGCGKSTLVNLIPHFYDASNGQILLDGCDVTQIDEKHLRQAIAEAMLTADVQKAEAIAKILAGIGGNVRIVQTEKSGRRTDETVRYEC